MTVNNINLIISKNEIPSGIYEYGYVTLGNYVKLSHIKWNLNQNNSSITLFTDNYFDKKSFNKYRSEINIGILLEPIEFQRKKNIDNLFSNLDRFNFILTYEDSLINLDSRFKKYIVGGTFLRPDDRILINNKVNCMSMILTLKNTLEGHRFRHEIYKTFKHSNKIDFYGKGINSFIYRGTPFSSYKYSIVIENVKKNNFFTEKIIDPLLFKCVPIYYGDPNIGNNFNIKGILFIDSLKDLTKIISQIQKNKLIIKKNIIRENQLLALELISKELNIENALGKEIILKKPFKILNLKVVDGSHSLDPSVNFFSHWSPGPMSQLKHAVYSSIIRMANFTIKNKSS